MTTEVERDTCQVSPRTRIPWKYRDFADRPRAELPAALPAGDDEKMRRWALRFRSARSPG